MADITDSQFYTDQVGTAGDTVVASYPKAGTTTELPPIPRNFAGSETAADVFNLARLLPGQRLRPDLCTVTHADIGSTTINIGDSVDPDRYGDGVDLGSAVGTERFTDPAVPSAMTSPFTITEDTQDIIVQVAGGTASSGAVVFHLVIESGSYNRGPEG